jgi:hypothetical protein
MEDHPNVRRVKQDTTLSEIVSAAQWDHFNIDLTGLRVVSDHGSALHAVRALHPND